MNFEFEIEIELSERGLPCLWECGEGMSNTDSSRIITDGDFSPKSPTIYIRQIGSPPCSGHALIPIAIGDYAITAYHHRGDFTISIYRLKQIDVTKRKVTAELVNKFSEGEWDSPLDEKAVQAVKAAEAKAMDYHCRRPYYIKQDNS